MASSTAITSVLVLLLTGCAYDGSMERQQMVNQGQPPQYAEGYGDGCASGESAAGSAMHRFQKDVNRFNADQLYAQGWGDGFQVCKGQFEHVREMLGPVF